MNRPTPNGVVCTEGEERKAGVVVKGQSSPAETGLIPLLLLTAVVTGLIFYFELSYFWAFLLIVSVLIIVVKGTSEHHRSNEGTVQPRRASEQNETVEWLNHLLNQWWEYSSDSIEQQLKKIVNKGHGGKLYSLEVMSLNIGKQKPVIHNVQAFEQGKGLKPMKWFRINEPCAGLDDEFLPNKQLVIQCDAQLMSEDFKVVIRSRVGFEALHICIDAVVDQLQVSGTLKAILHLSRDAPFPHIAKATISLRKKPDVTFNLLLMRILPVKYIPFVNSILHNQVMKSIANALVDPKSIVLFHAPPKVEPVPKRSKQLMDMPVVEAVMFGLTRPLGFGGFGGFGPNISINLNFPTYQVVTENHYYCGEDFDDGDFGEDCDD